MAGDGGKPDAGSPTGPDADSYVAMVARAKALIPELRDRTGLVVANQPVLNEGVTVT